MAVAIVAIVVVVAVGVFGADRAPHGEAPGAMAQAGTGEAASRTASDAVTAPGTSQPSVAGLDASAQADTPAPGRLSSAQWRTISDRIEPGPGHDRELARIASLMAFQDDVMRLRELRDDPGAAQER